MHRLILAAALLLPLGCDGGVSRETYLNQVVQTDEALAGFVKAIERYRADTKALPKQFSDLSTQPAGVEGWKGPYVDAGVVDVWGNPYQLELKGETLRVVSYAADGAPGGEEQGMDMHSQPIEAKPSK